MSDLELILGALGAGIALGTIFFGGLWWTVNRGLAASAPAVWFGLSTLLRMFVAVAGLAVVARSGLVFLMACLCGIFLARIAVTRMTRVAG